MASAAATATSSASFPAASPAATRPAGEDKPVAGRADGRSGRDEQRQAAATPPGPGPADPPTLWVSLRRETPRGRRPVRPAAGPARTEPAAGERRAPVNALAPGTDDPTAALSLPPARAAAARTAIRPAQPRPVGATGPLPAGTARVGRPMPRDEAAADRGDSDRAVSRDEQPGYGRPAASPAGRAAPADGVLPAEPAAAQPETRPFPSLLLLAAGLAAAGASAMRWSTLATNDEQRTFTGLTIGDGRITLILGLALAVLAAARLAGRRLSSADGLVGTVFAAVLVILIGIDLLIGPPTLASFQGISADKIVVRPEVGLFVALAAAAVGLLAAGALARADRPGPRSPARPQAAGPREPVTSRDVETAREPGPAPTARASGHRATRPR
jgi:hypothetical protein